MTVTRRGCRPGCEVRPDRICALGSARGLCYRCAASSEGKRNEFGPTDRHGGRRRVLGAMVPFNVVALGEGRFHRSTSGDIYVEQDAALTAERVSVPDLKMRATGNIVGVQWGKLIVNLNNALNALSGLPLREQLAQRAWRVLFADQMAEGLVAIRAEGISPVSPTPIPPAWMPPLLRLPDGIFGLLLGRIMHIDPAARSSMWEDLQ